MSFFRNESLVENTTTSSSTSISLGQTSSMNWALTPSGNATVTLPTSTFCSIGQRFTFSNLSSSFYVTVQNVGATVLYVIPPLSAARFLLTDNTTSNGTWDQSITRQHATATSDFNYITNPGAEVNLSGWVTFNNAASNVPSTGSGGSPVITLTRSTSSPLAGIASFVISKSAANRQGDGISSDFVINASDQAKVLQISFDYLASTNFIASDGTTTPLNDGTTTINSGNSDVEVFLYDITNAVKIPVTPQVITSKGGVASFKGTCQTSSNSVNYRLIFYVSGTNASSWTFQFDNVSVNAQPIVFGFPATDEVAYTPTITGFGTVSAVSVVSSRIGKYLYVNGHFTSGTPTAVAAQMTLGYNAGNTNVSIDSSVSVKKPFGKFWRGVVADAVQVDFAILGVGGNNFVTFGFRSTTNAVDTDANGSVICSSGDVIYFDFLIPIQGWSSNVQISNDAESRVVEAIVTGTPANMTAGNPIIFPTVTYDSNAAYNATTGIYTVPVSGFYKVSTVFDATSLAATNQVILYKNASLYGVMGFTPIANNFSWGSIDIQCIAGDTLYISNNNNASSFSASTGVNNASFTRVSGPSAIAASEDVNARYYQAGSQSITGSSQTIVNFDTIDYDSHNAVTVGASWKFTAPMSGKYRVSYTIVSNNNAWTAGWSIAGQLFKNGSAYTGSPEIVAVAQTTATFRLPIAESQTVNLLAGDFIDIRITQTPTAALFNNAGVYISIERVGN